MPDPADATKPLSELSEGQLLAEIQRVREWLAQHRPSEPGYDKIVIYRDWLEIERIRRHLTGRLTSAFGGEAVGARFIVQGFEPVARGLFWKKGSIVAGAGVVGGAAERFYGGSIPKGETFVDLNTKYPKYQKNFPVYDFHRPQIRHAISVKASTRPRAGRIEYYKKGLTDVFQPVDANKRAKTFAGAVEMVYPASDHPGKSVLERQQMALVEGVLAVNDDDVPRMRKYFTGGVNEHPENYPRLLEAMLRKQPLTVGGQPVDSFARLMALPPSERATLVARLADEAAERIVGHGLTTGDLRRLHAIGELKSNFSEMRASRDVLRAFPEHATVVEAGGRTIAAGRAAVGGATAGAIIAVVTEAGVVIYDAATGKPFTREEAKRALGRIATTSAAAAGGSAAETLAGDQAARVFLRREASGATTLLVGRTGVAGGRALTGGVGGGVAGGLVEIGKLLLDDKPHTTTDYVAKGTRGVVAGGVTGALTAGLVGAVWGSEVPVLGNIAGFFIGLGIYWLVDRTAGEAVEGGVRSLAGETPPPEVAEIPLAPDGSVITVAVVPVRPLPEKYPYKTRADIARMIRAEIDFAADLDRKLRELEAKLTVLDARAEYHGTAAASEDLRRDYLEEIERYLRLIEETQGRIDELSAAMEDPERDDGDWTGFDGLDPPEQPPEGPPISVDPWEEKRIVEDMRWTRNRLRELLRWLTDAREWETVYIHELEKIIAEEMRHLERLRRYAGAVGLDTHEAEDEPLLPPPPPPPPEMTVTYITPMEGYVNRRTGEYRLFPWGRRPKSPDWQPVGLDPTRGGPNMHWGWVHVTDPKTGESKWIPGWKLGPDPGRPAPGSDSIPGPAPHWTLEQLLRELRRAGIDVDRLLSMAGVDPSRPLAELYAEAGPAGARILGDRLAEALSAGLAERRAAAAVAGAALPPPRQDLAFVDRPVQPVRQPSG